MKVAVLLAASLALSIAGSTSTPEKLRFVPTEGLVLERTFKVVAEQETESSENQGTSTSTISQQRTLHVTDEVQAVDDDRNTKLTRTYEEISAETESTFEADGDSGETSASGSCEVEGSTVVFEWNEDDESYVATSDDLDDDVLGALVFDCDFIALLPGEEVAEGDEWSIDLEAFRVLADPWKGLPWDWVASDGATFEERPDEEDDSGIDTQEKGGVVATFAGTREADGVTVAIIALEGEVEIERTMDVTGDIDGGVSTVQSEVSETRTMEGEALWNMEGGRLHSMRFEVRMSMSGTSSNTVSFDGEEFEMESDFEGTGTSAYSVTIAVVE